MLLSVAFAALLSAAAASAVSAQSQDGDGQGQDGGGNQGPGNQHATPELDSVLLFGSGLAGLASYAALRTRSRR